MTEPAPQAPRPSNARPVLRADDGRLQTGGKNRYEPNETDRAKVRTFAKTCTIEQIAALVELSVKTLNKYYRAEINLGKAETTAAIGSKVIAQALSGDKRSQALYLNGPGGWGKREIEHSGPGGGPVRTLDLSNLTDEQLAKYEAVLAANGALGEDDQDDDEYGV